MYLRPPNLIPVPFYDGLDRLTGGATTNGPVSAW